MTKGQKKKERKPPYPTLGAWVPIFFGEATGLLSWLILKVGTVDRYPVDCCAHSAVFLGVCGSVALLVSGVKSQCSHVIPRVVFTESPAFRLEA